MDEIDDLIEKVKAVESGMNEIVLLAVRQNEKFVLELNVRKQLYQGVNAKGEKIRPKYAKSTIKRKKKKGHPYNRVTLKDEGDFYEGFFVEYEDDSFTLHGDDYKTKYLIKRYGKDIFGLNESSIKDLIEMIENDFIKIVKVKIND